MTTLCAALVVAIGVAAAGAASGLAAAKGVTDSYAGEFKDAGGTISFSVFLKDNGKPDEVGDIDPNDVEMECSMTGPTTASPTLTGETAKVKHREFKYRFVDDDDGDKIVFKGELRPGHKAKGTFVYKFSDGDNHCTTDGPLTWKAERVL
jgi:hypothetical protein